MEINHHVYIHGDAEMRHHEDLVLKLLRKLLTEMETVLLDISALTAAVEADSSAVDAAVSLLNVLAQEIRDNAADPAAIAAIADQVQSKASALADAVVANTPAAPATPAGGTGAGGTSDTGTTPPDTGGV